MLEKANATLFQALTGGGAGTSAMLLSRVPENRHHTMNRHYDSSKDRKVRVLKKEVAELEQQKVQLLGKVGEKRKQKAIRHRSEATRLRKERDMLRHHIRHYDLESRARKALIT